MKAKWLRTGFVSTQLLIMLGLVLSPGCRWHYPHSATLPPGPVTRTHAKPMEGGYYTNFDPWAAEIVAEPVESLNPVQTQHVIVARVLDRDGLPLPNRRVEWMIAEGSVGDFVEVDESGWRSSRGHKVDNHYAITHTNNCDHVLTRGTDDPSDDVYLKKGDTWVVITSPIEGVSHVTAYAPGIYDWNKHKVFVTKQWRDVEWDWPPDATNPVDTTHVMTTEVRKHSDGTPLEGYVITYEIISGPDARFDEGGGKLATVLTDAAGRASVTLVQNAPMEGTNEVKIDIVRPADGCCGPEVRLATGVATKTWLAPRIEITKNATPEAQVGENFTYEIVVSNPAQVAANDVVVSDTLPDGISYVSSSPAAQTQGQSLSWSLGTIGGGQSASIGITVTGTRTGKFQNCATVQAAMGLSDRACDDTIITAPALQLEKECPAEVVLCDEFEYRLVVRNTGDGPAGGVRIRDPLPSGLQTTDGKRIVEFDAGTLAAGEAKQATVMVKAHQPGSFTNVATATGDAGLTAEASCTTKVTEPVLAVSKTGPAMRFVGRPVEYNITVTNSGDTPANNTILTDTVPANSQFTAASDGGQFNQGTVTWNLGNLAPGGSRAVTLTLVARTRGTIRNTAVATAACAEARGEAETQIEGIPAILLEVVDVEDPIEVGENMTYVITVTNQGSADGTNIGIEVSLPPELDYVSAQGPTAGSAQGKQISFAPLPNLAPRAKATYRVVTKATGTGDVRLGVQMTSSEMSGPPVQETESSRIY